MDVEIRTYGHVRELIGRKELTREMPANATVGELLGSLAGEFEGIDPGGQYDGEPLVVMKNVPPDCSTDTTRPSRPATA